MTRQTSRLLLALCFGALAAAPLLATDRAPGPLEPLSSNPRWFTDGSGRAVFLAGSHAWWVLQDNGLLLHEGGDPPPAFDYDGFLDFLARHDHNFFRLWRWELPRWTGRQWDDRYPEGVVKFCEPHPWPRSGPGAAADGKPRFDLTRLDPVYFERLRSRVAAAGERGIYVAVMLFEGWGAQFLEDGWDSHPFNRANNVNGIDGDRFGYFQVQRTEMGRRILDLQEAYMRKVVDTVNDLDNVLYEVCNEAGPYSTAWQYHVIEYVKQYESGLPKQHPVGMTFQYRGGQNATLFEGPADWVSPNPGADHQSYRDNPPPETHGKVVVSDTDHQWGHTGGDAVWVWKSFARGLNVLLMEDLPPSPTWQDSARNAMGQARRLSEEVDLAAMVPAGELSSTGYCLAARGREYVVFQPGSPGLFSVDLEDASGSCSARWLEVSTGNTSDARSVSGGARRAFSTPFGGPAVLHLKCE